MGDVEAVTWCRVFQQRVCHIKPAFGPCPGCVTDADRALWGRLADEVDAYLTVDHEEGLFG